MKYLLSVLYAQGEDESDDAPDYFLLELEPAWVEHLAELARKVKEIWETDDSIRSIDAWFDGHYVAYAEIERLGLDEIVEQDEVHIVDLPDDVEIKEVWKMEVQSVKVYWDGDLIFSAFYKYTGVEFQTPLIGLEYLQEALKGE